MAAPRATRIFEDFARRFAPLKLTPAQFSTLIAIHENPDRRLSDLAASLGVRRPNFVAMADEPERWRLAERAPSAADRRAKTLRLTGAGAALLTRGLALQAAQEAAIGRSGSACSTTCRASIPIFRARARSSPRNWR